MSVNKKQLTESRTVTFRKEDFEIMYHYYQDSETGEILEDDELVELNQLQVHNQYREKHNLPFPEDIKKIRDKYGVSASKMAEILGFGINQYRNYEKGEIPSISNGRLIQMVENPEEFKRMIQLCDSLSKDEFLKLEKHVDKLIMKQKENQWERSEISTYLIGADKPCEETGFMKPNLEKFCNMLHFFAKKTEPYKTKMNKLMFYADFLNYKQTCFSISGSKYRAIKFGPVPQNFGSLYEFAGSQGYIEIEYKECNDGKTQEKHLPSKKQAFNASLFSIIELNTLDKVVATFQQSSVNKIVEESHKEDAWKDHVENHGIISYQKAFRIQL